MNPTIYRDEMDLIHIRDLNQDTGRVIDLYYNTKEALLIAQKIGGLLEIIRHKNGQDRDNAADSSEIRAS